MAEWFKALVLKTNVCKSTMGSNPILSFKNLISISMLILIVLLPLLGFFSGSLFGRFLGLGVCYITTLSVFSSFLISLFLLNDIIINCTV